MKKPIRLYLCALVNLYQHKKHRGSRYMMGKLCIYLMLVNLAAFAQCQPGNKTCNQATYHVQQLYQACPPKGI